MAYVGDFGPRHLGFVFSRRLELQLYPASMAIEALGSTEIYVRSMQLLRIKTLLSGPNRSASARGDALA